MKLRSIQVGLPQTFGSPGAADPFDREWITGFFKEPVDGPLEAGVLGLTGDGQADLKNHGGPDKAINVYPISHYGFLETQIGRSLPPGAFGENFTTDGAIEEDVCIGDVYALGSVRLQVSQPRQPCWKLARRWRVKDLAAQVQKNGKTGWYLRVLETGMIAAPAELVRIDRPYPEWTVTRANAIMHQRVGGPDAAHALAACPALSDSWRTTLSARSARSTAHERERQQKRLGF